MAERPEPLPPGDVTGLILAGGRGSRMGGIDKGLQPFLGRSLAAHCADRLAPQTGTLLISANRHAGEYARWGWPVLADATQDYDGPLAGVAAGLAAARTRWVACVPCDSPLLPLDLVARLSAAAAASGAELAVARSNSHRHPLFALADRALLPGLAAFLARGGRRVREWQDSLRMVEVDFPEERAFANVNTLEQLRQLESERSPAGSSSPA